MKRFCQALSLCLAWAAVSWAESEPARGALSVQGTLAADIGGRARLAPLRLAASSPAEEGAAGAGLCRLRLSSDRNRFHPARFRGRAGCGAPGTSSSRFLPATERSPSALSGVRRRRELTDLSGRRIRSGRGGPVRLPAGNLQARPLVLRVERPAAASILSVSSSLCQPR